MKGIYLCPTPIGNLEDITIRTLNILKQVDVIACEDTRVSRVLLDNYEISKKTISYHKFNFKTQIPLILEDLRLGKTYALITDAGMPGISDPGTEIVKACIDENIEVNVLPGPSASLVALVLSGLDTERFTFIGFLPEKSNQRIKELEDLISYKETLIIYESPHRIKKTLNDIFEIFGNRKISISREISKLFEETIRGNISDILLDSDSLKEKGEFVIVIEGCKEEEINIDIKEELEKLLEEGFSKKDSVKIISEKYKLSKNEVYQVSLEI